MNSLSIDLETYSDINLADCGVYKYVESPNFEILLFGYSVDGNPVQVVDLTCGEKIPNEILRALKECGCEKLVNQNLIEQYAMSYARYIQCEQAISEYGLLAKHPTTNQPISSPFVTMSNSYQNKANQIWAQIYQVVKENCSTEYSANNPHEDMMERLLRAREKGQI
ncbi:MAG: P27 family phage terminase small subunit [Acutalibacteraceae bacterium]